MDLHDLWQGHKRFLLGVVGGVLAFFVARAIIGSLWDVRTLAQDARSKASKLRRMEAPSSSQLARLRNERADLEERLARMVERMQFRVREADRLPADARTPDLLYNEIRSRARDDLVDVAARHNIVVDETLGLPEFTPSGREAIQRYLRGLGIVEDVVGTAIVAGVDAIPEIEVVAQRGRRRKRSEVFVDPLRVRFVLEGSTAAVAEVIHGIVRREEGFLSVEEARLESDSKGSRPRTVAKLTVAGLVLHPEVEVGEKGR